MNDGLAHVRAVLGSQEECGLEDSMIKDALWNEYFNVENAIQGLLGLSDFVLISMSVQSHIFRSAEERERHQKAIERKGETRFITVNLYSVLSLFYCCPATLCRYTCLVVPLRVQNEVHECFSISFLYLSLPCVTS